MFLALTFSVGMVRCGQCTHGCDTSKSIHCLQVDSVYTSAEGVMARGCSLFDDDEMVMLKVGGGSQKES